MCLSVETSLENDVIALEHQVLASILAKKHDELIEVLDDDFSSISFHGFRYDRRQYIDSLLSGSKYYSGRLENLQVLAQTPLMIVTGTLHLDWERGGVRVTGPMAFTKVWVKRPEGYRVLHLHSSDARLGQIWSRPLTPPPSNA